MAHADTIKICIGNYGSYAAGYLLDKWVELPMSSQDLSAVLQGIQDEAESLVHSPCEEFYVSDYDGYPFGLEGIFKETTSIEDLNLLAHVIDEYPDAAERVACFYSTGVDEPSDVMGLINMTLQAEELPYYTYDCDQWYLEHAQSNEEKLGASIAQYAPWYQQLEANNVQDYFDLARYGESQAQNCHLGDDGYVDAAQDFPSEDEYSREEVVEMFDDLIQTRDRPPAR